MRTRREKMEADNQRAHSSGRQGRNRRVLEEKPHETQACCLLKRGVCKRSRSLLSSRGSSDSGPKAHSRTSSVTAASHPIRESTAYQTPCQGPSKNNYIWYRLRRENVAYKQLSTPDSSLLRDKEVESWTAMATDTRTIQQRTPRNPSTNKL